MSTTETPYVRGFARGQAFADADDPFEAEQHARCYADFSVLAAEFNRLPEGPSEDAWEDFERGVAVGIEAPVGRVAWEDLPESTRAAFIERARPFLVRVREDERRVQGVRPCYSTDADHAETIYTYGHLAGCTCAELFARPQDGVRVFLAES